MNAMISKRVRNIIEDVLSAALVALLLIFVLAAFFGVI